MIVYVLDDGETWTLSEPTPVAITEEQLTRLEGGEKFYHVVPDWDEVVHHESADDFFIQAGSAAAEALREAKRNQTKTEGGE